MKKRKILSTFFALSLGVSALTGCTTSKQIYQSETIEQGKWLDGISTDLAAYKPGEPVTFKLSLNEKVEDGNIIIHYKHLDDLVYEQELEVKGEQDLTWEWTPSDEDYVGYMIEVYLEKGNNVVDHLNIAVDVSSDWSKFPRYGYLADFYEKDEQEQRDVIENLNRFHINGIQFYDWQYKHESPLKIENGKAASEWLDVANRQVLKEMVENYISLAHGKNMKAMNYNLLFGASDTYEEEGVKKEWGLFKDPLLEKQDVHPLPEYWGGKNIYLMEPTNEAWQNFIFEKEKEVFNHLPFDGWHVDQLGDRGALWGGDGERIDLAATYAPFLQNAKEALQVDLVMNAVSQYGQADIAGNAPVNFLYTETWDHPMYGDLKEIIDQNTKYSNGKLNTVLAAYMNYDLSNSMGEFNTPGVLLTDAVIFAAGGSHIELGENMLSKEYFPHKKLKISDELHEQLIRYYDFSVAYQNLLRDGGEEVERDVTTEGDIFISTQPEQGLVWNFVKQKDNQDILHFINFTDASDMEWKDNKGEQAEPELKADIPVTVTVEGKAAKVWMASPDVYNGTAVELDFEQKGDRVTFTLPSLKYWDMVVIEYKS